MPNINLNTPPYYDDFDSQKNFLRVLFRPGYAVQARELTQLQSILQNQVSSASDHIFKNNTPILNGQVEVNFDRTYFKVEPLDSFGFALNIDSFVSISPVEIVGSKTGAKATISSVDSTERTIYFDYNGGTFDDTTPEEFTAVIDGATVTGIITQNSLGRATSASVSAGIFYTDGFFAVINKQETIVDKLSNTSALTIGFSVVDSIITEESDQTLYDPAQGSFNYNAPGATRLNKKIVLVGHDTSTLDTNQDTSFIGQVTVDGGIIISTTNNEIQYADLMDTLARRTFDESGNYTIEDFPMIVSDDPADNTKLSLSLEEGKAYVQGFEIEKISPTSITTDKAQTTNHLRSSNQVTRYISYGPYIDIEKNPASPFNNMISGIFNVSAKEEVTLHPQDSGLGVALTDSSGNDVKFRISTVVTNAKGEMRVYLADAEGKTDLLSSAKSIKSISSGAWANFEKYTNGLPLVGGKSAGAPLITVESNEVEVKGILTNQTTFQSTRSYHNIPVTAGSAQAIQGDISDTWMSFVPLSSGGVVEIVDNTGAPIPTGYGATVVAPDGAGSRASITFTGLGAATSISVILKVDHASGSGNALSKTLLTSTDTLLAARANNNLTNEDVISIVSVFKESAPGVYDIDITNSITFDSGQRDFYYGLGSVSGVSLTDACQVTYSYYGHTGSLGKYFSADSYPNYSDITPYVSESGLTKYDLRNTIDFRRKLSDINAAGGVDIIVPDASPISFEYEYYVSRIDKVFIDGSGKFGVKQGIPSRFPEEPSAVEETMTLFTIKVPAFTFSPSDVETNPVDNRRHTMADISELESRIENLEYYTSLNSLESDATKRNILDSQGNTMFKNGILVDSFKSFNTSDEENSEFRCTIDETNGKMRGTFTIDNADMFQASQNATLAAGGITVHENSATLNYTTKSFISQYKASTTINVNPYAIFSWQGEVKLRPASDHWVNTQYLPVIRKTLGNPVNRQVFTQWGSWKTVWRGVSTSNRNLGWGWWSGGTTTTQTTTTSQNRRIYQQTIVPTIKKTLSDKVVSNQVIPYMRSRMIRFSAVGMRQTIALKATFNGVDVSALCYGLKTDISGNASGWFMLPKDTFTVGQKEFKLFDATDGEDASSASAIYTSSGILRTRRNTITTIHGSKVVRNNWLENRVTRSSRTWTTRRRRRRWYDPIAQSFLVSTSSKKGVFLDSIDIAFRTADSSLPVRIQIVEMDNGYPTQDIVPFSEVSLEAGTVLPDTIINDGASQPKQMTNFKFSDPVYLQEAAEYALVVLTNSTKYEMYIANMGEPNLADGKGIFKQPYAGVMFKSQNASTWTAEQNSDITFNLNQCVFDTNIVREYTVNSKSSTLKYTVSNPYIDVAFFEGGETVTGNTSGASGVIVAGSPAAIEVNTKVGTFIEGETIIGAGGASVVYSGTSSDESVVYFGGRENQGNGTPNTTLFVLGETISGLTSGATATVAEIDHWRLILSTRNAATFVDGEQLNGNLNGATALAVGTDVVPSTKKNATHLNLTMDTLELDGTRVDFGYKFANEVAFSEFTSGEDVGLSTRNLVDYSNPFEMKASLSTSDSNVSPVVSLERVGVTLIDNDDWKRIPVAAGAGVNYATNELVVGSSSGATGYVKEVLIGEGVGGKDIVVLSNHNRISFNNTDNLVGAHATTATTLVSLDGSPAIEELSQGTYVTVPVELTTPADDLRVIIEASIPPFAEIRAYFSAIVNLPRYLTINNVVEGAGHIQQFPSWADPLDAGYGLQDSLFGVQANIYDISTADGATVRNFVNKGQLIVTKAANDRIYTKTISDITSMDGTIVLNRFLITTETLDTTAGFYSTIEFVDYDPANTTYLVGDYVFFGGLLWKATKSAGGLSLAQPSNIGSDWSHVPGLIGQNTLVEEAPQKWRAMKYVTVPSGDTSSVTEYTFVPDEIVGEEFDKFSVKLELIGQDPATVPTVENFRAIAVS